MIQQFHSWIYIWKNENTNMKGYIHLVFTAALFIIAKTCMYQVSIPSVHQ